MTRKTETTDRWKIDIGPNHLHIIDTVTRDVRIGFDMPRNNFDAAQRTIDGLNAKEARYLAAVPWTPVEVSQDGTLARVVVALTAFHPEPFKAWSKPVQLKLSKLSGLLARVWPIPPTPVEDIIGLQHPDEAVGLSRSGPVRTAKPNPEPLDEIDPANGWETNR